jgi:hypothetical protein
MNDFTLHPWALAMFGVLSTVYNTQDQALGFGDGHWISKAQADAIVAAFAVHPDYVVFGDDPVNISPRGDRNTHGLLIEELESDEVDGEISHLLGWFSQGDGQ